MHKKTPAGAGQKVLDSGYNHFHQHDPRATFIVTTPASRGKNNRDDISTINANSALLRHARARVIPAKASGPTNKLKTRNPRTERSPTVDSGYLSDLPAEPKNDHSLDLRSESSILDSTVYPYTIRDKAPCIENGIHNSSNNSRHDLSLTATQYSLDRTLQSSLDPFLQLSIDLSRHERGLLHFYLTDARTIVFGNSPRPQYDVAVYCARIMLGHCSLYTVVKLASAESILCRAIGKELSPAFYYLRARAYNMMNTMLNDPETNFFDKAEGFNQLGIMEMFLNHSVEHKRHLQAMWDFIEENGGCSKFLSNDRPRRGTLGIGVYSCNFVYVDMPVSSKGELDIAVSQFTLALKRAIAWYRLQWSRLRHKQATASAQSSSWKPKSLQAYLDWLIECFKMNDSSSYQTRGAFHSIYNLFMTLVIFDYDARDSRLFLWQVDSCMQQRPVERRESEDTLDLVPASHLFQGYNALLFYVRDLVSGERQEAEVELCQSSVNALKIVPLLSRSSILRLVRDMIRCLLMPVNEQGHNPDSFDEDYLQDLAWETEEAWKTQFYVKRTKTPGG